MSTILVIPTDGQQIEHMNAALESWQKYGPEIDHIIVVGETEGLVPKNWSMPATLWPVKQLPSRPRQNNQHNLAAVLKQNWADDVTFIWTHDDIFLTRPFTLMELERLTWCALREDRRNQTSRWTSKDREATETTLEQLEMKGLPTHNYELHLPLVITPEHRQSWVDLMPRNELIQMRTWVLNHLATRRPVTIKDVKLFKPHEKLPAMGIYSTAPHLPPLYN